MTWAVPLPPQSSAVSAMTTGIRIAIDRNPSYAGLPWTMSRDVEAARARLRASAGKLSPTASMWILTLDPPVVLLLVASASLLGVMLGNASSLSTGDAAAIVYAYAFCTLLLSNPTILGGLQSAAPATSPAPPDAKH